MVELALERDVKLACVSGRRFSPAVRAFLDYVKSCVWTSLSGAAE